MTDGKQRNLSGHVLGALAREDLNLIVELVLRSGSLKDLALAYGVTYPTIRLRLDRVIARLQEAVSRTKPDPFKELLAELVERGELSIPGARAIRDMAQAALEERQSPTKILEKGGGE